jgi:hypothetical protein
MEPSAHALEFLVHYLEVKVFAHEIVKIHESELNQIWCLHLTTQA